LGGGAFAAGGGVLIAGSRDELPKLSPSVFIAACERTIETLERFRPGSTLTTKSKVFRQVGQVTRRSSFVVSTRSCAPQTHETFGPIRDASSAMWGYSTPYGPSLVATPPAPCGN